MARKRSLDPPKRRNPAARALACPSLKPRRVETKGKDHKADRAAVKRRLKQAAVLDPGAAAA